MPTVVGNLSVDRIHATVSTRCMMRAAIASVTVEHGESVPTFARVTPAVRSRHRWKADMMDGERFDELTRALADGVSRRRVLKTLAGGVAGGLLGVLGGRRTEGQGCRRFGQTCTRGVADGNCCSGFCRHYSNGQGRCACPAGTVLCADEVGGGASEYCAAIETDVANCGQCHRSCVAPANGFGTCVGGQCGFECTTGYTACHGACVDTLTDSTNCGGCAGAGGATCASGVCSGGACLKVRGEGCVAGTECVTGSCVSDICCEGDCDDGNPCSAGSCGADGTCRQTLLLPTIACPPNASAAAAPGTCGSAVMFGPTVSCADSVSCSPATNTSFAVGTTTVTCTATNQAGSRDCSFAVTVRDEQDPSIQCPSEVTTSVVGSGSTAVSFVVSATDNCSASLSCDRASGSVFSVGTTRVTCTATDAAGRKDTCQFPVTVSCTPDCTGKTCGASDGCGGRCVGSCPAPTECQASVTCNATTFACDVVPVSGPFRPCNTNKCKQGMTCDANGTCQGGFDIPYSDNIADKCNRVTCDPAVGITKVPTNEGGRCQNDDCNPGACVNGVCTERSIQCPACQTCSAGQCVPSGNGTSCGNGKTCLDGFCCNLPKTSSGGLPPTEVLKECSNTSTSRGGICCETAPCCPGTGKCCDACYQTQNPDGTIGGVCCTPEQICGGDCCWDGRTCVNGTCVRDPQVCAGNVACDDVCCGRTSSPGTGTCCGANSYCSNDTCIPRGGSCTSHAQCVAAGYAQCAGLRETVDFSTNPPTVTVTTAGTCCPAGYAYVGRSSSPGFNGPVYACCEPGTRYNFDADACCGYPEYSSQCSACRCSFVRTSRCCRGG